MRRRSLLIGAAVLLAGGVAGCGERPQVVQYKQGTYQGKQDQQPWDGAQFNGNEQDWERAIRTRNQQQNEYKRVS
jgi:hypothetical protein